ncbi:MAG: hypothetical protein M3M88_00755 [Thermoproteota archaeon]|nr:hypothetical protein [Thermoproteota archaeon]
MVIELLNKEHTAREIAKMARVSFSYIKKIRMKLTGDANEEKEDGQKKKPSSSQSHAFKLFLEGKSIIKVVIELDLSTEQILKIHSDCLMLQSKQEAVVPASGETGNNPIPSEIFQYKGKSH